MCQNFSMQFLVMVCHKMFGCSVHAAFILPVAKMWLTMKKYTACGCIQTKFYTICPNEDWSIRTASYVASVCRWVGYPLLSEPLQKIEHSSLLPSLIGIFPGSLEVHPIVLDDCIGNSPCQLYEACSRCDPTVFRYVLCMVYVWPYCKEQSQNSSTALKFIL